MHAPQGSVAEMGAVPERTPVGHGARGLRRRRAMRGTTSATIRRARVPTAGARTASPASPTTSRACASPLALWNGKDPILKERLFGLTNSEGNHGEDVKEYYFYLDSDADAFVHEVPVQVPAARVPLQGARRDKPGARPHRPGVRADRHGRLRRQSLLRRVRRIREGSARGHVDRDHRITTAARSRRRCSAADVVVPQHLVMAGEIAQAGRLQRCRWQAWRGDRQASHPDLGERIFCCDGGAELLFTENETNHARVFGTPRTALRTSRTASTTTS